jgi:DNA-binding NarL/FixJ family response regulator
MSMQIVIADDHAIVIDGLRALLRYEKDIEVVGTADNGAAALELIIAHKPDLVLIDMAMPVMNGNDVMRASLQQGLAAKFIVLSMHSTNVGVARALRSGASGYVLKESAGPDLIKAIRAVMAGEIFLTARLEQERAAIESLLQVDGRSIDALTQREREVMQLIVNGRETSEIAEDLDLSGKTVATYRSRIFMKLGVTNVASLIRFAIEQGIEPL